MHELFLKTREKDTVPVDARFPKSKRVISLHVCYFWFLVFSRRVRASQELLKSNDASQHSFIKTESMPKVLNVRIKATAVNSVMVSCAAFILLSLLFHFKVREVKRPSM